MICTYLNLVFLDSYVIFYIWLSVFFILFFFVIAFLINFRLISLRISLVSFVSFSLGNYELFSSWMSKHYYTFTFKITTVTMGTNVEKNKLVYLNLTSFSLLYTSVSTFFRFVIIRRIFVITVFPWKFFIWKNLD